MSKKIGQYYTIAVEQPDVVEPGHCICDDKELDVVIGFVYDLDGIMAEMVLFEPEELPELAIQVLEMNKSWEEMLKIALSKASEDTIRMWESLFTDVDL